MKNLKLIAAFALGAVTGGFAVYSFVKERFNTKASKDIQEAREHYEAMQKIVSNSSDADKKRIEELEIALRASHDHIEYLDTELERLRNKSIFVDAVNENGYSEELLPGKKPYFVDPLEENDLGYNTISLTLYDDQTLTDESDKPMSLNDIYNAIGSELYETIQTGDDDYYLIRNEKLKCDFEISRVLYDYYTGGD